MHGLAWTFSEQMIASIIDDSRCGIGDVAFHTAPPIGGLSCLFTGWKDLQPLLNSDKVTNTYVGLKLKF